MSKKNSRRQNNFKKYSTFWNRNLEGADSFLCEECRPLGFCKIRAEEKNREIIKKIAPGNKSCFDISDYLRKIPFRISDSKGFSNYAKEHLQKAYDAFHQEDYETALINYKCVERGGIYYNEPDFFLALAYFMLGNYQSAATHMQACIDNTFYSTEDFNPFIEECERLYAIQQVQNTPQVDLNWVTGSPNVYANR